MRVSSREFDRIADAAFARIAPKFRRRLRNVLIVVEQEPPEPNLLGLYQGRPLTERSVFESSVGPDKITIYQGPHQRIATSLAHLERIVHDTIWHEIAHYFGMNERQVLAAERLRRKRLRTR
jgi:predicted Zn-dependent protease with MMP-like domain